MSLYEPSAQHGKQWLELCTFFWFCSSSLVVETVLYSHNTNIFQGAQKCFVWEESDPQQNTASTIEKRSASRKKLQDPCHCLCKESCLLSLKYEDMRNRFANHLLSFKTAVMSRIYHLILMVIGLYVCIYLTDFYTFLLHLQRRSTKLLVLEAWVLDFT